MVGSVGDLGCRNILPKTFFSMLSVDGRGCDDADAERGLRGSLFSDEAKRVGKRVKRLFAVAGGVDAGGVRGDQADCS